MDPQSSIPVRSSGIPRPASRLPVLRSSGSQSQLRPASSTEQLRKKPAAPAVSKPPSLQKKPSGTSLARSTSATSAIPNTGSNRPSLASATKRTVPSGAQARPLANNASVFKKPVGRPPSRQTRIAPPSSTARPLDREEDELGDLDAFRSASRASSRAGFHEAEPDHVVESDVASVNETPAPAPASRKPRPSLADRTIESLSQIQASPAGNKSRRRSSFFNADNSMPPPMRPASALSNGRRPTTSDGTPAPATPRRPMGGMAQRGSMTAPGKRSVSAAVTTSTPSKTPTVARPSSQIRKFPLSQMQNLQTTPKPRPLSNSKTMTARTPKARPSLAGTFGEAISPPETAGPLTPITNRKGLAANRTPDTGRKVSSSSLALREQIAKAKAARIGEATSPASKAPETQRKTSTSSSALREQIAKAKEAARRAQASRQFGVTSPPREVPAVTENEFGIEPDPAEIAEFDFGLDDPFNQGPKGSKSLIRKRVDAARVEGRLNLAAMGLSEIPDEVLNMYKYDLNDSSVAWGEVVDIATIIAADNELESLPEAMFPDVDMDTLMDSDEDGPQFGGVQSLDFHGNVLRRLPVGLIRLTQLSKLNLSRNRLPMEALDVVCQISTLRELRMAENALDGDFPSSLGALTQLEVLELQGNKLTSLPSEIRELTHLRTLNVADNKLKSLPSELFTSVPIIELIASKNAFSGSFFEVDTVPHLQHLNLSNNSISSLCETGTVLLPALKTLKIASNRLNALPDISSWTSLTTLLVSENKLTSLPEGFVSLTQLRAADFTANDLTKIDEKIALMENLNNLTLAANPLRERKFLTMNTEDLKRDLQSRLEPSSLDSETHHEEDQAGGTTTKTGWTLKPSGTLDLSSQSLTALDEPTLTEFAESNDVRQLYLQQNALTSIPAILSSLTHLTTLNLSKNKISTLSAPLHLPHLRDLHLQSNTLTSLSPLTTHLTAPLLQTLDISNNSISGSLPPLTIYFPSLTILKAADNAIEDADATALKGLKVVNLSNNELAKLDPRIGLLELRALEVEGNRFRVPGYMVLRKGTEGVLMWLRGRVPEGETGEGEL